MIPRAHKRWRVPFQPLAAALLVACSASMPDRAQSHEAEVGANMPFGQSGDWSLVFHDEFEGADLDRTLRHTCHWWDDHGCTIKTNNELQWYRPENVELRDGHLVLRATERGYRAPDGKDFAYTSGMVSTGQNAYRSPIPHRFADTFFYAEIRARIPTGRGLWPALRLLPAANTHPPEIDIMEVVGQAPRDLNMTVHFLDENGQRQKVQNHWRSRAPLDDWHIYAVDWQPGRIIWFIDGQPLATVAAPARAIPQEPMYFVANLALGGDMPGPPGRSTVFPTEFEIDFVRIWKRGGELSVAINDHARETALLKSSEPRAGSGKRRPELDRLYARVGQEIRQWFAQHSDTMTLGGTAEAARPATGAPRATAPSRELVLAAGASLLGAFGACILSLGAIDTAAMTNYGLISVLPVSFFLAVALVAVTLVFAQTRALATTPLPILALVMLVLLLHGTPAIVYDTLRYPWAWRHIGIIDLLLRDDGIDPADSKLLIYLDWPLFFVVFAKISQFFDLGLHALAEIGRVFPVLTNLMFIPLLFGLFRRFSDDPRLAVRAMALLLVGNWIGQDYFSPQAVAFLLYLSIMALSLTFLGRPRVGSDWFARIPLVARLRAVFDDGRRVGLATTTGQRRAAAVAAGLLIVGLVATHQLPPILLLIALGGLFAMGRIGFALPLFALVAEVVWFVFFAEQTMSRLVAELASELGHIGQGTFGAMVDAGHVSTEQRVISFASRGLSGSIGLLAIMGIYRRRRAGSRDAVPLVLVVAPILLIPMTSYGGEIVFRAYYFALPFLAFFAAAAFAPAKDAERDLGPLGRVGFFAALIVGAFAFLLANNGKDRQYNIGADEVAAVEWLQTVGAPGALLIEGNINYPRQTRYPEKFFHLPLNEELPAIEDALRDDPAGLLSEWLAGWPGGGYILITRAQIAHDEALRLLPGGGPARRAPLAI